MVKETHIDFEALDDLMSYLYGEIPLSDEMKPRLQILALRIGDYINFQNNVIETLNGNNQL